MNGVQSSEVLSEVRCREEGVWRVDDGVHEQREDRLRRDDGDGRPVAKQFSQGERLV